jgi:pantoate--beta-alanine ligase
VSDRAEAVQLSQSLKTMAAALKAGATDFATLEAQAMQSLATRGWQPDYLAARRRHALQAPTPGRCAGGAGRRQNWRDPVD